ncbi:MAG: adenosylcobinamide-GDP ribazoletransferase, partial [Candidatus Thorarchaeota archaeon]
ADLVLGWFLPVTLRCVLDLVILILLTGGLHLDGLADSADGLLSHRGRDEAMRIMKDTRIGTWGVVALLIVLGLKTAALHEIIWKKDSLFLILVPTYGRFAMLLGMAFLPYGRGENGIAHDLYQGRHRRFALIPGIVLVGLVSLVLLGWPCLLLINGIFLGYGAAMVLWFYSRMRCITGDMLGALGETSETVVLMVLAVD